MVDFLDCTRKACFEICNKPRLLASELDKLGGNEVLNLYISVWVVNGAHDINSREVTCSKLKWSWKNSTVICYILGEL